MKKVYEGSPGCTNSELLFIMKRLQLVKNFAIIIICLTEWAKVMFFIPEKEASFSGTKHIKKTGILPVFFSIAGGGYGT